MLLKIKESVEPCFVSVVVLMRGCSGTGEYEAGKENKSQYTHYNQLDYTTGSDVIVPPLYYSDNSTSKKLCLIS